ncbi:MAG: hypothetical protein HC831_14520 [Chloroflexia bacterium]|nr:hypothetical protein [Chloroflexia bacterium]
MKKWNSTHGGRVWDNNIAEGYPAFAENVVSAGNLFLGDFRDVTVGQFQNVEMIVDPYTMAAEGKIKIVIDSLFDSGLANYRGFTWISDASVY